MAQTTAGLSFVAAQVFISDDVGVSWTELTGHGASIAVSGGDRAAGEQNTFAGVLPIVKFGKRSSIDVTCRYVFTEEDADPFNVIRAVHESDEGAIDLQYSPSGDADGFWFDTGAAGLISFTYPGGESGDGAVSMCEFVVKCASLTKADASTAAV